MVRVGVGGGEREYGVVAGFLNSKEFSDFNVVNRSRSSQDNFPREKHNFDAKGSQIKNKCPCLHFTSKVQNRTRNQTNFLHFCK